VKIIRTLSKLISDPDLYLAQASSGRLGDSEPGRNRSFRNSRRSFDPRHGNEDAHDPKSRRYKCSVI
jgi:hypothetical protein